MLTSRYIHEFENNSININVWNYILRSNEYNYKYYIIGPIIFFIQLSFISLLIIYCYLDFDSFNFTDDILVILVSILGTMLSTLYSFDMIN